MPEQVRTFWLNDSYPNDAPACSTRRNSQKIAAVSSIDQRPGKAASHPPMSVSGAAVLDGSELIKKRPSGATSYCQFAIRSAAMRV